MPFMAAQAERYTQYGQGKTFPMVHLMVMFFLPVLAAPEFLSFKGREHKGFGHCTCWQPIASAEWL